jgi:hypothetical protein
VRGRGRWRRRVTGTGEWPPAVLPYLGPPRPSACNSASAETAGLYGARCTHASSDRSTVSGLLRQARPGRSAFIRPSSVDWRTCTLMCHAKQSSPSPPHTTSKQASVAPCLARCPLPCPPQLITIPKTVFCHQDGTSRTTTAAPSTRQY